MLLPTAAGATTTGSITGTVTAPVGFQIVVTICAIARGGEEACATTLDAEGALDSGRSGADAHGGQ